MNKEKRRNRIITLIMLMALALTASFAACNNDTGHKLQAPTNLQISGNTLTWDKVENSVGYLVNIDGKEKTTPKNTYDLSSFTVAGKYEIKVIALGDGKKYWDSVWSDVKEYAVENLEYSLSDTGTGYTVKGIGTVTSKEIDVPATFNGLPVVEIGIKAFENNVNITKVTLHKPLSTINNLAFTGCTALESIELPDGLTFIGMKAFSGSGLKYLSIPDSILGEVSIMVDNCVNLEYIKLPNGINYIYSRFFYNTPKLKSVTLPESVSSIGPEAFVGSSIESIKIPKNVRSIYESSFENTKIRSVEFEKGSVLESIYEKAFKGCSNIKSIVIPATVKGMGESVFYGWGKDQTIYIETLTEKPFGWSEKWSDGCNAKVVWGYKSV